MNKQIRSLNDVKYVAIGEATAVVNCLEDQCRPNHRSSEECTVFENSISHSQWGQEDYKKAEVQETLKQ